MEEKEGDPFAIFDDGVISDDEDIQNCDEPRHEKSQRDNQSCGVMTFHPNTELSLLIHVRQALLSLQEDDILLRSRKVLSAIDEFCLTRHWMMHIGPTKGEILVNEVNDSLCQYRDEQKCAPFLMLELGTYCGYSSIMLVSHLLSIISDDRWLEFKFVTVEIDEGMDKMNTRYSDFAHFISPLVIILSHHYIAANASVARQIIELAGLSTYITIFVSDCCTDVIDNIILSEKFEGIDFLFIDHDKDSYLSDFKVFESHNSRCLRKGSKVVADNVLFAGIHDYLSYMKDQQALGKIVTMTKECTVEYCSVEDEKYTNSGIFLDGMEISSVCCNHL